MKRLEDWPERLAEYLEGARGRPFSFGTHDCATFAAGAVAALTDAEIEVPRVESAADYARFVLAAGSLHDHVVDRLGEPLPSPAHAQRGDLVLMLLDDRPTLGVCIGAEVAGPGPGGMVTMPMSIAAAAWRV